MRLIFKIIDKTFQKINILKIKLMYGNRFQYESINTRGNLRVYMEDSGRCVIGNAFFNYGCSINCQEYIEIGKTCIFGENVKIYDHNHVFNKKNIPKACQGFTTAPIFIGNNVWIGSNCTILKGVHIGDNCVIGANCLINQDVPANTIVRNSTSITVEPIKFVEGLGDE